MTPAIPLKRDIGWPNKSSQRESAVTSRNSAKRHPIPLFIAIGIYVLVTVAILIASCRGTGRHLIYPLDDTYIEMAMAKNIATHGVWGVSPYEFSSSASTPLFVLTLAATFKLFGVNEYAPLVLSWTFGLLAIWVASRMLRKRLSDAWQTLVLVALVLFTPMFVVGILGMEHSLHLLLTLLFLNQIDKRDSPIWTVAAITALMVATRYEGLFLALTGIVFLVAARKFAKALAIAVSALVPIGAYALFSINQGGYWLPNSVALKGTNRIHGLDLLSRSVSLLHVTLSNISRAWHLVFLLGALSIAAFVLRKRRRCCGLLVIVAGACCIHMATADVGWVFRYEDYLIASAIVILACSFSRLRESSRVAAIAVGCFLFCSEAFLIERSIDAAVMLPGHSLSIYSQQWQMAAFLKSYYPNARIAANDIGAIDFVNDLHLLDLVGLASGDVLMAKRKGRYSTDFIEQSASKRDIQIAIVYDAWFSTSSKSPFRGPPLPKRWIRVRRWTIPYEDYVGDETVSFYALNPDAAGPLQTNLIQFERTMPRAVETYP